MVGKSRWGTFMFWFCVGLTLFDLGAMWFCLQQPVLAPMAKTFGIWALFGTAGASIWWYLEGVKKDG